VTTIHNKLTLHYKYLAPVSTEVTRLTFSDGDVTLDDGLSRRHDGSLITVEDEFGGVSRDQSEKHT